MMDSKLKGLYLAMISDVHLGCSNNPTDRILRNLSDYAFPNNDETKRLNIIFINGDWFHTLLDNASENTIMIRRWVAAFLRQCAKNDTMVRVLKGTRIHDWDQLIVFIEENENHNIGCDLKYIQKVHIEYIERYDLNVLYVPDEANVTAAQTWTEVEQQLREHGLTKVDLACMHGGFPYQLPPMVNQTVLHDPDKYLSIVEYFISIGHVHTSSVFDRILAQGSFDRIAHGEEGAKGHFRIDDGVASFVENKNALRFLTVDVTGMSTDKVIQAVDKALGKTKEDCHVRLKCKRGDVGVTINRRLSLTYPNVIFDPPKITETPKKAKLIEEIKENRIVALPTLTRDNLESELILEIKENSPDMAEVCREYVGQLMNVI